MQKKFVFLIDINIKQIICSFLETLTIVGIRKSFQTTFEYHRCLWWKDYNAVCVIAHVYNRTQFVHWLSDSK